MYGRSTAVHRAAGKSFDRTRAGRCDALVSDEEIERRKQEEGIPPVPESQTPWQELYRASVDGLDGGGVLEMALKYRGVASETPRHNH